MASSQDRLQHADTESQGQQSSALVLSYPRLQSVAVLLKHGLRMLLFNPVFTHTAPLHLLICSNRYDAGLSKQDNWGAQFVALLRHSSGKHQKKKLGYPTYI